MIVLWVLGGFLQAQVPGYAGKRVVVLLGTTAAPSILYGIEEGIWSPNVQAQAGLEWVCSRRLSCVLSGWGLRTRGRYANYQLESGFARIEAAGLRGGIRLYQYNRSGTPAPMGPFHEVGLGYLQYRLYDLDGIYQTNGQRKFGNYGDSNIYYKLGYQNILGDWFVWEVALEASTLLSLPRTNFRSQVPPRMLGRARLIRHMALGLHLGVGIVLR